MRRLDFWRKNSSEGDFDLILTIAAAVFVFGLLVLVHEFGHFITAKMTGMRVDEFAIGFGPKLISKKHGETVYSLRAIPLGGFNDIAGMDPDNNTAGERGFCSKHPADNFILCNLRDARRRETVSRTDYRQCDSRHVCGKSRAQGRRFDFKR